MLQLGHPPPAPPRTPLLQPSGLLHMTDPEIAVYLRRYFFVGPNSRRISKLARSDPVMTRQATPAGSDRALRKHHRRRHGTMARGANLFLFFLTAGEHILMCWFCSVLAINHSSRTLGLKNIVSTREKRGVDYSCTVLLCHFRLFCPPGVIFQ